MGGHNTDTVDERDALIASLQQENEKLLDRAKADPQKTLSLEERLNSLLNAQYGKRSERFNPDQLSLLNEAEVIAASEAEQANEQDNVSRVAAHQRHSRNQRQPIPDHLLRVDVTHELD